MTEAGNWTRIDLSVREGNTTRGGAVQPDVAGKDKLLGLGNRNVLLLVHGFNNNVSQASEGFTNFAAQIKAALEGRRQQPDAVFGFHWPGNAAVGPFSFMDFAGYPVDVARAREAAASLANCLWSNPDMPMIRLVLVGHSLGCRLLL